MPTFLEDIESGQATEVNWEATRLSDQNISDLLKALSSKKCIVTSLNFDACDLTDDQFNLFAEGIAKLSYFENISVRFNDLTNKSIPAICNLIATNKVKQLNISGNNEIDDSTENKNQIKAALKKNSQIDFICDAKLLSRENSVKRNENELFSPSTSPKSKNGIPISPERNNSPKVK